MLTLTDLLEAGAHFGHKKERSYPKAKEFTYTIRDNVYVIDLEKTIEGITKTNEYLQRILKEGKTVLFVGTKRQAKTAVEGLAKSLRMPYVVNKWLGGMLTNFETITRSLKKMIELESLTKSPEFEKYTKKERRQIEEKLVKLQSTFGGLGDLKKVPDALFIVDAKKELVALTEARKMNIPVIAICDTDSNPDLIDIAIPANDDSEKTIKIILESIEKTLRGVKSPEASKEESSISKPEAEKKEEPSQKEKTTTKTKKTTKKGVKK